MKKRLLILGLLCSLFLVLFAFNGVDVNAAEFESVVEGVLIEDDIPDRSTFVFEDGGNYCSITFDSKADICIIDSSVIDIETGEVVEGVIETEYYADGVNRVITIYDPYGEVWQEFKLSVDGTRIKPIDAEDGTSYEDAENTVFTFLDWIKNLSFSDFQNIVIAICSFFGVNILSIVAGIITFIRTKSKEIKNNRIYQTIIEEMSEKHKLELAEVTSDFSALVEKIDTNVKLAINQQSASKQKETVEKAQQVADEINAIVESLK